MKPTDSNWELIDRDAELVSQYLDGELAANESRELERRLHQEPMLRAALVRMQECNNLVRDLLAEKDSVPESVTQLFHAAEAADAADSKMGEVLPFPAAGVAATAPSSPRWAFALAASVCAAVGAVLLSNALQPTGSQLPGNDAIVSNALQTLPSGYEWNTLADGREFQGVLTFPHEDGSWCREYLLRSSDDDWRAVACLDGGSWVTQAAGLESYLETSNAYRPAGAADSAPVAVFISQHAAGIALDGRSEEELMSNGWR